MFKIVDELHIKQNTMTQYLITGYDHTDADAFKRRTDIRPHHLDALKQLKRQGNYILGGAILDDEGRMVGSTMIMQFETEEQLETWKQNEPYITMGVWETVDIKPFKVAVVEI